MAKEILPHPWCEAEAAGLLGGALLAQKQFDAAETNLLPAYDELQANYGRVPAHTGPRGRESIGQWIIQLQEAVARSDFVEQWRQRIKGPT